MRMADEKKVFVLDTSVLIFDHKSILNFDEHDVTISITILESERALHMLCQAKNKA